MLTVLTYIHSLSVKFYSLLRFGKKREYIFLSVCLSGHLYLCFYTPVYLNMHMFVSFSLPVCVDPVYILGSELSVNKHVCRFYQSVRIIHMHVSISLYAALYIRMYAQKPQLMPILLYLEVNIFF